MMKSNIFKALILISIGLFVGCNSSKKHWQIKGSFSENYLSEKTPKKVYLHTLNENFMALDAIDSSNIEGAFFGFSGALSEDDIDGFVLKIEGKDYYEVYYAFIESDEQLKIEIDTMNIVRYSGSPKQDDFNKYMNYQEWRFSNLSEILDRSTSLEGNEDNKIEAAKLEMESFEIKEQDSLIKVLNAAKDKRMTAVIALIEIQSYRKNEKKTLDEIYETLSDKSKSTKYGNHLVDILNHYSAYDLYNSILFEQEINIEFIKAEFDELSQADKKSNYGKLISQYLQELSIKKDMQKSFFNIKGKNLEGNLYSLNDVDSKLILVDFWASWCAPCRKENPEYRRIYDIYKDEGFEIFGYSLDTDKSEWEKAVKEDKLPWIQVSNLVHPSEDEASKVYKVRKIPTNILIKNGEVIGRDLFGEKLEETIANNL